MTTQATNPIAYALGEEQAWNRTHKKDLDSVITAGEWLIAVLDAGSRWEIDLACTSLEKAIAEVRRRP